MTTSTALFPRGSFAPPTRRFRSVLSVSWLFWLVFMCGATDMWSHGQGLIGLLFSGFFLSLEGFWLLAVAYNNDRRPDGC